VNFLNLAADNCEFKETCSLEPPEGEGWNLAVWSPQLVDNKWATRCLWVKYKQVQQPIMGTDLQPYRGEIKE
jgi:hypothetical protein